MGWLTLRRRADNHIHNDGIVLVPFSTSEKLGAYSEHTEDISIIAPDDTASQSPSLLSSTFLGKSYPFHPTTPDDNLPYISPSILLQLEETWKSSKPSPTKLPHSSSTKDPDIPLWIVINDIVYDCTAFQHTHPGGSVVIRSFVGQDCSWQFWRFHAHQHLREYGKSLRIGRTSGVQNRFKEPPRFVGLSSGLGDEDW
ncbi:cytochrome b5-like heme/steroid binding domain-containing protein [Aspergillus multicolor]|uniref:cytochrome b5-like heme/steroid binding domain-containing protein n=1 Tax=Aspergillus multicolor TaxID=41759 RepID=UPI003CCD52C7